MGREEREGLLLYLIAPTEPQRGRGAASRWEDCWELRRRRQLRRVVGRVQEAERERLLFLKGSSHIFEHL